MVTHVTVGPTSTLKKGWIASHIVFTSNYMDIIQPQQEILWFVVVVMGVAGSGCGVLHYVWINGGGYGDENSTGLPQVEFSNHHLYCIVSTHC